jgi:hypothetical protein
MIGALGDMSSNLNQMIGNILHASDDLRNSSNTLRDISSGLSTNVQDTQNKSDHATQSASEMSHNMDSIAAAVDYNIDNIINIRKK